MTASFTNDCLSRSTPPDADPTLYISRANGGQSDYNPRSPEHLLALNALRPEQPGTTIFITAPGDAFAPAGFAKTVKSAGNTLEFSFRVYPHQLRPACAAQLDSPI